MLPFKKILCPTDFSEPSFEGLNVARELGLHFSAELILTHVVGSIPVPIIEPTDVPASFDIPSYQGELEASATNSLQDLIQQKIPKGLRVRAIIGHGDAAEEIVRTAVEENADLIVIATHGMTGWRHLIFGSVAEKVVRRAGCPVLTVRAPRAKQ